MEKNAPTGITLFPFDNVAIDPNGVMTKYIRVGFETFAVKKGTNQYFYHNDHLGGVNSITDAGDTNCQANEYDPWGSVSKESGNCDPTHRFTGKELDPETGIYYYGGRYYDQEISRFISPDPFVPSPDDPQSLNRYSYVNNNPERYTDPSGYDFGDSAGSYSFSVYGWVKFFMDLSSHHHHPKPVKIRVNHPMNQPRAKNWGGPLSDSMRRYVDDCTGDDCPEGGGSGPVFIEMTLRSDKPEQNGRCVEFTALQKSLISILATAASYWNQTIGIGLGASAGGGNILGASITYSNQILVSPNGQAGVMETMTSAAAAGPFNITSRGLGAYGGLQFSVSNAHTPKDVAGLGGNAGVGYSAQGLAVGQDLTVGKDTQGQFVYQTTTTVGFGFGGYGHALSPVMTTVTPMCPR